MRARILVAVLAVVALAATVASTPASASSELYANDGQITIPSSGNASPYPSSIDVQNQPGKVVDLAVSLRGLTHSDPADVDVLLVAPNGRTTVLMSDACLNGDATGATLTFTTSSAFERVPVTGNCTSGVYRATNYGTAADSFPGAPAGPYAADLTNLVGDSPNGTWSLYVVDDASGDSGKFATGWTLTIATSVPDAVVPGTSGTGAADPYPLTRTVSGMTGVIEDINVTLRGVYHQRPADLNLLLVSPSGDRVRLLQSACNGGAEVRNATWTWDDAAAGDMPRNGECPSGRYKPTAFDPSVTWPAPAPGRPYDPYLSSGFNYTNPNGEWRLYAYDSTVLGDGYFIDRFELDIKTRPVGTISFEQPALELREGQSGDLTLFRSSGGRGAGPGTVTVTTTPLTATSGADYAPVTKTVDLRRNEQRETVSVSALADTLPEDVETFSVTLSQPTGDAVLSTTAPVTATVTILDIPPVTDPGPQPGGGDAPGTGGAAGGGGGATPDRTAPTVGRLAFAPSKFAVAPGATAKSAAKKKKGTRIGFALTEAATVTLRIERRKGRRYTKVGTLKRAGLPFANRVPFTGRIGRKALRPGAYRVVVTAVDAAGNRSVPKARVFRVVP